MLLPYVSRYVLVCVICLSHTHTHTHTHAHALAQVLRLNHIGDWGTQFGMLIQHMNELNPGSAGGDAGQGESISDLMALYRYA